MAVFKQERVKPKNTVQTCDTIYYMTLLNTFALGLR